MDSHTIGLDRRGRAALRLTLAAAAVAGAAFFALAPAGFAQSSSTLDARWQPWIGCWKAAAAPHNAAISFSRSADPVPPVVCVIPSGAASARSGVEVVTVTDGKIVARDTIDPNGRSVLRSKDGCTGTENASWSANGHRLYVSSDFTCPGGVKRTSAGIFAIAPNGDWVNVQGVDAAGAKGVRTLRYSDAGIPQGIPPEIASAIQGRSLAASTARAAAAAPLTKADIIEASHSTDSTVVEAWIVDRGQKFSVDANNLIALADAGVPGNVTDAMVAVSYPKAFVVNPPSDGNATGVIEQAADGTAPAGGREVRVMMVPSYSPYGFSPFDYYGYGYLPYGYSPYGYSPYGYSPYGAPYSGYYGSPYGGIYAPPVIVLKGSASPQRGYVVKGGGYTRTPPRGGSSGSSGSTAEPRPTASSPPSSNGNSSPPPPPPPSSSSGRTAHQRP
jgi:hypothetical protein